MNCNGRVQYHPWTLVMPEVHAQILHQLGFNIFLSFFNIMIILGKNGRSLLIKSYVINKAPRANNKSPGKRNSINSLTGCDKIIAAHFVKFLML